MSLLLDALKRAEEAKRAKLTSGGSTAEKAPGDARPAAFETSPISTRPSASMAAPIEFALEEPHAPAQTPLRIDPPAEQAAPTPDISRLALEISPPPRPTDSYAVSRSNLRTTGAAPPAIAARIDEAPSREAAKNVFAAKQAMPVASAPPQRRWAIVIIGGLLALVAGGAWYVWNDINKSSRPPAIANTNRLNASGSQPLPTAARTTGQLTAMPEKAIPAAQDVDTLPPLLPPPAAYVPLPTPVVAPVFNAGPALSKRELLAKSLKEAPVQKEPTLKLTPSRELDVPRTNAELLLGYEALKVGDYARAKQLYAKLLAAAPDNLDALLGIAAAETRSGEIPLAAQHYRDALAIDPRNGVAIASLTGLINASGGGTSEIELRKLIANNPDVAPLHFSLGNTYAREKRWSEAQQAFFEAYRLDSESADYAYNLAVSLDQLRQPKLARNYYQTALAMLGKSSGQFDRAAVTRRIGELSDAPPAN